MSEMISWHKVGQKVVAIDPVAWVCLDGGETNNGPLYDEVCTITGVFFDRCGVWFELAERNPIDIYWAENFRPVYPQIIESLKQLDAPTPAVPVRAREHA